MLKKLTLVAVIAVLGFTSATSAQNQPTINVQTAGSSNSYFNIYGGYNALHDYVGEVPVNQVGTFNGGFILGSAWGKNLGGNRRFEIDSAFRYNTGNTWTTFGSVPFDGRVRNYSTMFNLIQDFGAGPIKPYIGGGVGVAYIDGVFDVSGTTFDTTGAAFAYQGIAGISVPCRLGFDFYSEYRFYGNTDVNLVNTTTTAQNPFTYLSHDVVIGIRIPR